jgi:hypothetical protein
MHDTLTVFRSVLDGTVAWREQAARLRELLVRVRDVRQRP